MLMKIECGRCGHINTSEPEGRCERCKDYLYQYYLKAKKKAESTPTINTGEVRKQIVDVELDISRIETEIKELDKEYDKSESARKQGCLISIVGLFLIPLYGLGIILIIIGVLLSYITAKNAELTVPQKKEKLEMLDKKRVQLAGLKKFTYYI
jgi:hypothetical protein